MPEAEEKILKINCPKCGLHLDVTLLEPLSKFQCPDCGEVVTVPKPFGRYMLDGVCGYGGMATVYTGTDTDTGRRVAVKITNPEMVDPERDGKRFLFEVELVSRVDHPGIIKVYSGGIFENQPFMVMEYMSKGNLERMLKEDRLPPLPKIMTWMATIADGLNEAHKVGIVHHDVKPGNIMLSENGEAKIGDFDLAELRTEETAKHSADWASPAYVSPERLYNGCETYKGDIFSLGVTIYELVSHRTPFPPHGEEEELLEARKAHDYPNLPELNPAVHPEIGRLVERMLSFSPDDRPEYEEVIETLAFNADSTDTVSLIKRKQKPKGWLSL